MAEMTSDTIRASACLLLVWFLGYGFSCGPVPYVLASEVGSANLRQKTIALARSIYYATLVINSVVAPYMLNPTKGNLKGKAAFPAAGFLIACLVWGYYRLPETKDRTFSELDILFGGFWFSNELIIFRTQGPGSRIQDLCCQSDRPGTALRIVPGTKPCMNTQGGYHLFLYLFPVTSTATRWKALCATIAGVMTGVKKLAGCHGLSPVGTP